MHRFGFLLFALVVLATLSGCESTPEQPIQANDPFYAPIIPDYPKET